MRKVYKKAVSLFLVACMIFSMVVFAPSMSAQAATSPIGSGKYIVSLTSDPTTTTPGTFGSAADAGRIWTDKSVSTNSDGSFDVSMSVLGQEYMNTYEAQSGGGSITNSLQADVVFILDMSMSMSGTADIDNYTVSATGTYYKDSNGNYVTPVPSGYTGTRYTSSKITRLQAMVNAANNAIGIIMASNPNNRVGVYWFGGALNSAHVGTFMSMGSYTLSSGTTYLDISGSSVSTNTNLRKDGTAYTKVSVSTGAGTPTQDGIIYSIQTAIADINAKATTTGFTTYGKRQPFLFLLSDGAATIGNASWWTTPTNATTPATYTNRSGSSLTGTTTSGSQTVAATTILTAAYQKNLITAAYKAYNLAGGNTTEYPTLFYSVGLGPNSGININSSETADTSTNYAWCALNPGGLISNYSYNGTVINKPTSPAAVNTKSQIATYITSASSFPDASKYSITGTPGFVYSKYYFYAPSYPDLDAAFTQLSNDVANATKSIVLPVESSTTDTVTTTNGDKPVVVLSDTLGSSMALNGVPSIGTTAGVKDTAASTATKTVYTFIGYDAIAVVENGVITFYVFPDDFIAHMYAFTDSQNPVEGSYNSASPLKLTYNVKPTSLDAAASLNYYSNAFTDQSGTKVSQATATYRPAITNPYYYYTNSYVGLVGALSAIGQKTGGISGVKDSDITHYVKGTVVSNCTNFSATGLTNVYVTYAMAAASGSPLTQAQIGTLININGADIAGYSSAYKVALNSTIYGCVAASAADSSSAGTNFAFLSGINRSSDTLVTKSTNATQTASYSSDTTLSSGILTSRLGNNGKLSILLGIDKKDVTGPAGSTQKYEMTVTNYTDTQQTGITVSDIAAFTGTAANTTDSAVGASFSQSGTTLSWSSITIPAHGSVTLSYTLKIPTGTAAGTEVTKDATLTYQGQNAAATGKTTVTALVLSNVLVTVNKDNSAWAEFTGVITLKDSSGNIITSDNFNKVPDGTYTICVDGKETNVSFTVNASSSTSYLPVLNYYTLTVSKDTGIDSVSGGGIFLSGESVSGITASALSGYSFDTWSSSAPSAVAGSTDNPLSLTMPAQSLTLTAKATANEYAVKFDANDGSYATYTDPDTSVLKTITQTYNEHYVFPDNPARAGYTFSGWNTSEYGTGDAVSASSIVNITAPTTLYAVWTELDSVRISYVSKDTHTGTVTSAYDDLNPETGSPAGSTASPLEGYKFVKWINESGDTVSTSASFTPQKGTDGKYSSVTYTAVFEKLQYTITSSTDANGSISPLGDTSVEYGSDQEYTFTPAAGYHIADVKIDGVSSPSAVTAGTYTFENVTGTHTIDVTFAINTYTVTPSAGPNGSISPDTAQTAEYGDDQTYTFTPGTGYTVKDVLVDGASVGASPSYTFTKITANHIISVEFEKIQYTITSSTDANGSISPLGDTSVEYGGDQTYTFSPNPGYHIADVKIDGVSSPSAVTAGTYTFENVTGTHTIDVTFAINTYTVTPSAGPNGTISPDTAQTAEYGDNQTYTFTPDTGYIVKDVLVDGVSTPQAVADESYTFTNITANHTVSVEFEKIQYIIQSSTDGNGGVSPLGDTNVAYGGSQTYTFTPDTGYHIDNVLIDGVSNPAAVTASSYTFENVVGNHTVEVSFAINTYTVTPSAGPSGTITPDTVQTVDYGSDQTFTFAPDDGYHIDNVLIDGVSNPTAIADGSYTFTGITGNHTIDVTFAINTYTVTPSAGPNGSISPDTVQPAEYGDNQTYFFMPDIGYHVDDVLIDGVSNPTAVADGYYIFSNIMDDHTIDVTFAINTYTITPSAGSNGSISPDTVQTVDYNGEQTFSFAPAAGYHIDDVLIDGVSSPTAVADGSYTFTGIARNHTIDVTFAINTYTVTPSAGPNGSISPDTVQTAEYGDNQTYTFTPDTGYTIKDVLVDGVSTPQAVADKSYTFTNITANHTVSVEFEKIQYIIHSSTDENGSITPLGDTNVQYGGDQEYTFAPTTGYHIADVKIDGISNADAVTAGSYTFEDVTANHTIDVTFAINTYTVTPSAGENGSITPNTVQTVNYGTDQTFSFAPVTGYHIADVKIDGVSNATAIAAGSYTFEDITANHTIDVTFAINTYTVTPSAGGNGSITPNTVQTVNYGSDQAFTFAPTTGYHIADVKIDGVSNPDAITAGTYTFEDVTANHTIDVTFVINTYTVTPSAGENGSITPNTVQTVNYGGDQAFTFAPVTGYHIADVKIDGVSNPDAVTAGTYTFEDVTANHTIDVTFAINTYTVTPSAGENGSITPNTIQTVNYGGDQAFTFAPTTGYHIADVKIDGVSNPDAVTAGTYTFEDVTANHTIDVTFAINTYTVTPSAGENGSITPNTIQTVNYGGDQAFTFAPTTGYHIADVKIDGVSNPDAVTAGSYTFTDITDNHTIDVTFAINTYTVTPSAGENGSITPNTIQTVNYGSDQAFTFAPTTGYHIADVKIDGVSNPDAITAGSYTFEDVTANHTIDVTFAINTYTVTPSAGENGSITPNTIQTVNYGGDQTFTFAPVTGYHIADVKIDGVSNADAVAAGTYTFEDVTANHTIDVTFAINTYTVTPSAGENGSITPNTIQTVNYGDDQTFSFAPVTGYHIADVKIDGVSNPDAITAGSYTFEDVTANHTIDVTFAINTYTVTPSAGGNGSITPNTVQTVNYGSDQAFTFAPTTGYHIADVKIDGVSNPDAVTAGTYTFEDVTANHTIDVTFAINTYTVTPSAGGNGSITPNTVQTVNYGSDQAFTFAPTTGYHIADVKIDGVSNPDAVTAGSYTFEDVTANHTIDVTFAINTYTVTPSAGENGSITPNTIQTVNYGGDQTFTFAPVTGYHIADVKIDGVSNADAMAAGSYTFEDVTANHTIDVTFAINTYTVTPSAGENGSITPNTVQPADYGDNQTYFFIPDIGYHIDDVLVDGVSNAAAVAEGYYTFNNITDNHTIDVTFAINTYTVTPSAGENGSITPNTVQTVNYGGDQAFTFAPTTGYHIADVKIDGVSNPDAVTAGSYTFEDVTANHTIDVTFAINTYTVTPSAGENGSITPNTIQTVNYGGDQTFSFAPTTGYHIADVKIDGVSNPDAVTAGSYTFEDVEANHTIDVTFAINTYTVTPSAGENGSITPNTTQMVNYGGSQTFTFTPDTGYRIKDVLVDGVSVGTPGSYTFTNITANHTVSVVFEKIPVIPNATNTGDHFSGLAYLSAMLSSLAAAVFAVLKKKKRNS